MPWSFDLLQFLCNKCVTGAQDQLNCTFIFKGVDTLLVRFADDLLNLSCAFNDAL